MSTAHRSGPDDDDPWGDRAGDDARDDLAPRGGLLRGTTVLSLLGEVGLVGVAVAVLSLPLVSAVAAVAAGALHLRRHLSGEPASLGRLVRLFGAAVRELWAPGLVVAVVLLLTGVNLWLTWSGALPGGALIGVVSVGAGAAAVVVALRVAGCWQPGTGGRAAVRAAVQRAGRDLTGSVLLVLAVVLCGALVQALEALVLLVGGLLAMAAVVVEHRYALRTGTGMGTATSRGTETGGGTGTGTAADR